MADEPRVFLDTSALFAAILSESGGARMILRLGEAGALSLWIGPRVLAEADDVLGRKAPASRPLLALLLDRARAQTAPAPGRADREKALDAIGYAPDAGIAAEAIACRADYLVSLDRAHLVGNPKAKALPFPIGTPGDFLAWFRTRLARQARERP